MSVFKSKTDAFFFTLEHSLKDAAAGYGVKIVLIEKKIFNPKRFWVKVVGMKNGKTVQCDINFERDKVFVDGWYRYNEDKMIKTVADVALDVMTQ